MTAAITEQQNTLNAIILLSASFAFSSSPMLVAGGIVLLLLAGWAAYQQAMVRRLKLARTQFMAASEEAQRQSPVSYTHLQRF